MRRLITCLRCTCCNEQLEEYELERYEEFGGMKQECYEKSLEAAYEDLPDVFTPGLQYGS